jgi:ubiquinone biosynthesis protein UbiJ
VHRSWACGYEGGRGALAALLGDEKLAHMARYALETFPDPSVDGALRSALGSLKGGLLVGAVQSVGVRRDAQSVDALAGLLGSSDPEVALAASRALGRIASPTAEGALKAALANRPVAAEGLLICAEKQ